MNTEIEICKTLAAFSYLNPCSHMFVCDEI